MTGMGIPDGRRPEHATTIAPARVAVDTLRLQRVAAVLIAGGDALLDDLLVLTVELLSVSGATISVIDVGQHRGALARSDIRFDALDELQFALGEGPAISADLGRRPVLEPDLERAPLWPTFASAAIELGMGAVFAFPIQLGAVQLGVLSLYRISSGDLDDVDVRDAVTLTHVATHVLLQLEAAATPGALLGQLEEIVEHRARVHQATGMVAAQLSIDVAAALSRLRAFAWSNDRSIDAVAADIVARRLHFELDG
jgi:hypothetical protein